MRWRWYWWIRRMAFSEIRNLSICGRSVSNMSFLRGEGGHASFVGEMCQYLINTWLNSPCMYQQKHTDVVSQIFLRVKIFFEPYRRERTMPVQSTSPVWFTWNECIETICISWLNHIEALRFSKRSDPFYICKIQMGEKYTPTFPFPCVYVSYLVHLWPLCHAPQILTR